MEAPAPYAAGYQLRVLKEWLAGRPVPPPPADVAPEAFLQLTYANRTAPLMYLVLDPALLPETWREASLRLQQAYHQSVVHGLAQLSDGARLSGALTRRGIPVLAFRGPFAAQDLYGEPGVRPAADIDLLVPRACRNAALRVAEEAGYDLCDTLTPRWFYRRNHFQWTLRHRERGTLCDLHWAVQQPYKPIRMDYEALFRRAERSDSHGLSWTRPAPGDALLLACIHLGKEYPAGSLRAVSGGWPADVAETHVLLPWLDVARLVAGGRGRLDWPAILACAEAWRVQPDLAAGLAGAAAWFGAPVPAEVADALQPILHEDAEYRRIHDHDVIYSAEGIRQTGRYRSMLARFGLPYLFPPRHYFGRARGARRILRQAAHAVRAAARLALGLLEGLVRDAVVLARRRAHQRH